jgi:uncharacterized sodium:solute symporter family permease YidK
VLCVLGFAVPAGHCTEVAAVTAAEETMMVPIVPALRPWTWLLALTSLMAAPLVMSGLPVPMGQYTLMGQTVGMEQVPVVPVVPATDLVHAAPVPVATGR